jgi:hypothetical protein
MDVSRSWPIAVDVRHGLAAVQYTDADEMDDSGHTTTSMLGCRCRDVADAASPSGARLSITCAISPFGAEVYDTIHLREEQYILPVEFQLPSAAYDLRCAQAEISVQSVRWPLSRTARPDPAGVPRDASDPLLDGGARQGPRELDAVLYVTPRCAFSSAEASPDLACLESFTRAGCFPYCLAGRVRASMNSVLILYDANDWQDRVQLLTRDCGLGEVTVTEDFSDNGFEFLRGPVPASYDTRFDVRGTDVAGTTIATRAGAASGPCLYDATVATRVRSETLPAYDDLQSVRLAEQPFVVAGDASLFVEWEGADDGDPENDRAFIRVARLFGSESGQFTLWTMPGRVPTLGTCATAVDCGTPDQSLVTLPWAYSRSPGNAAPAVATKWSVLFAVNPSPDIYHSFFDYCAGEAPPLQFQIVSAYGPIRIWRVDAFLEGGSLAAQVARDDVGLAIPAFDGETSEATCAQPRNLSVTGLTYIDEYNVAVTLLRASPRYYDVETKRPRPDAPPGAGEVSYDVYYLNPRTMRLQTHDLWQEDVPVSTLAQGYLCPAVRRVPPLGGLLAESAIAAVSLLVRFPTSVLLYAPALGPANLRHIRECPAVTRGHAILRECGVSLLSLAYLWEALLRGNTYFWMSLADVAQLFSGTPEAELTRTLLNGVAVAGVNGYNVIPYGSVAAVNGLLLNRMPARVRAAFAAVGGGIGLIRFVYETVQTLFVQFLTADHSAGLVPVVEAMWGALYGMRLRYEEVVTTPGLQTCTGLGLMLGWGNPFARLARDACIGTVQLVPTALRLGTVFFVHYPVLHCMCQMPGGVDVQRQGADECLARAPLAYRPMLAEVIERGAPQVRGMCVEMSAVANDELRHAPDLLFSVAYDIAEDVQDVLNYLIAIFDGSEGSCTDFYSNPFVMVLMPFPVDYFRTCGRTETCRLRCADLFAAFESSRARSDTGAPRTIHETTLVEFPFLSEEDIAARRHLQPFQVLGMIEHASCAVLCGASGGRCLSVAGVNAVERLAVASYCVSSGTGLRETGTWEVAGSEAWTASLLDVQFLHLREPVSPDAVLAVRADGLFLCAPAGVLRRVVGLLGPEISYSWSAEAMHTIDHAYVLPGRAAGEDARVVVYGTVRHRSVDEGVVVEELCVFANVDLDALSPTTGLFFYPVCEADENLREFVGEREIVLAADHAVLVPTASAEQVQYCAAEARRFLVEDCVSLGTQNGVLYDAVTFLSTFRSPVAEMFTLSREGVTMRRQEVVSQSSVESYSTPDGSGTVVAFFKTAHAASSAGWLSDVRVFVSADGASLTRMEERRSVSRAVALTIERECSVMSCAGCAGVNTQKLCYAAQQCAIARCVGSVVHMNRPACMIGIVLKDLVETRVASAVAVWGGAVEVLQLVVDASTGVLQSRVAINFPHDAVDAFVCDAKDVIVGFFGMIMSVVNAAVVSIIDVAPSEAGGQVNEAAVLATQVSAALVNFFAHVTYGILYIYFASYQTLACTANSALAIFDVSGASVRLLPSAGEAGWDAVGGQCVTKIAEESLTDFGAGSDSRGTVIGVLDDMVETYQKLRVSYPIEALVHVLDAALSWLLGVVRAFGDVLQVADVSGCRLADTSMRLVGTCACGDTPVEIPVENAGRTFLDSAFWCTGTLRMTMPDGSAKIIFQPNTLADLRAAAAPRLDRYLDCISGGFDRGTYTSCFSEEPRSARGEIESQGVSLLAVMARCRGNYANKQWDDGAAYIFNHSLTPDLRDLGSVIETRFPSQFYPYPEVASCLLAGLADGTGTDACLDRFLRVLDVKKSEYFVYGAVSSSPASVAVDACEVFTGPAAKGIAAFEQCLEENQPADGVSQCELPYFLWSGRSANRIPVAAPHVKIGTDTDTSRFQIAETRIAAARTSVLRALDAFLDGDNAWDADGLEVTLFTSEGDALHQALDCMVLGPYAAVDLWPAAESLPAATFSRQPDGASSREFELPCSGDRLRGDRVLPFTCGSPARRATMKYFLRDHFAATNESLARIVRDATLRYFRDLRTVWADPANFGCPCAQGRAIECCTEEDETGWVAFLDGLAREKEIRGSELTAEMLDELGAFLGSEFLTNTHEVLTRHADTDYAWTPEEALRAVDLGLFYPRDPVVFYDASEVASPFKGNASLFDVCVAHLSSVIFTLPLSPRTWSPTETAYDPAAGSAGAYVSALEDYVRTVTRRAEEQSPLFWHHVLRHVPSESQMCLGAVSYTPDPPGTLPLRSLGDDPALAGSRYDTIRNNVVNMYETMAKEGGTTQDTVDETPPDDLLRLFGAHYTSFAAMNGRCVCGWLGASGCYVPAAVCAYAVQQTDATLAGLRAACDAAAGETVFYDAAVLFWEVHLAVAAAPGLPPCDNMAPSDLWGVLDGAFADRWIEGESFTPTVDVREVLTTGRAGLRLGNLLQVRARWSNLVHPGGRHRPIVHPSDRGRTVAQSWCLNSFAARVSHEDLLDRYVDELFPVAQGVRGAPASEACMRYMIELARFELARLAGLFRTRLMEQRVDVWRQRCAAQLDTVAACTLRGAYEIVPETRTQPHCPFTVPGLLSRPAAYVTESCLVYDLQTFHDPCLCGDCVGAALSLAQVWACPLPLDVRTLARHPSWGGPFRWPLDDPALADAVAEFAAYAQAGNPPFSLEAGNLLGVVYNHYPGLFNTEQPWATAEGVGDATIHCDSVVDWWPEEWEEPVGYHVTTPPFADEAGYRVFDNAFAIDRGGGDFVLVRYVHDYLRNETLARNHFGASGLCGTHSYGMEMREVNSERVCTRVSRHDHADPAVPLRSFAADPAMAAQFFDEECAETYDVPWEVDRETNFDSARWAGLVGEWTDLESLDWPPVPPGSRLPDAMGTRGRTGMVQDVLGPRCSLPQLTVCETDADCVALALLAAARPLRCRQRVCVVAAQTVDGVEGVFQCARHTDCVGGLLCSGLGMCVSPVLQFSNERAEEIEAQVFSTQCAASAQSMLGASPWDVIPDLLPASGLCSYRAWFEQTDLLNRTGCTTEGACPVDSREYGIRHSDVSGDVNRGTLWDERRLRVAAHVCDRDYMHLAGARACTPTAGVCHTAAGVSCTEFRHARLTRTYGVNGTLALHVSPEFHGVPHGFLGLTREFGELYDTDTQTSRLRFCSEIPQCTLPAFTMNGFVLRERVHLNPVDLQAGLVANFDEDDRYGTIGLDDYFLCGAFGILLDGAVEPARCLLDPAVTPLYHVFCGDAAITVVCPWSFPVADARDRLCALGPDYDGDPESVAAMAAHLNWLLDGAIRPGFDTLDAYRTLSSCATDLWVSYSDEPALQAPLVFVWESEADNLRRQNSPEWLYYFDTEFPHTATELPFAWWVKCTLLNGIAPAADKIVPCPAWTARTSRVEDAVFETVGALLRRLDAHVTQEWWRDNVNEGAAEMSYDTCRPVNQADAYENEDFLAEMFLRFREYVAINLEDELTESLGETCFEKKEFDVDAQGTNRDWMRALRGFYLFNDERLVLPEYVRSTSPKTEPADPETSRLWIELCRHWFEGQWFEEDTDVLSKVLTGASSITVGRFSSLAENRFEDLRRITDELARREECFANPFVDANPPAGAPDDRFCIFRGDPNSDPLVVQEFGINSDPEFPFVLVRRDQDPANTLDFFVERGRRSGERNGIVFRDICEPEDSAWTTRPAPSPLPITVGSRRRLLSLFGLVDDIAGFFTGGGSDDDSFEAASYTDTGYLGDYGDSFQATLYTDTGYIPGGGGGFGTGAVPTDSERVSSALRDLIDAGQVSAECGLGLWAVMVQGGEKFNQMVQFVNDGEPERILEICEAAAPPDPLSMAFSRRDRDPSGQACSLSAASAPDTCEPDWLGAYQALTGDAYLQCDGRGGFRDTPAVAANPAGDVCWSRNSTCLFEGLAAAGRMRFPPGVTYWLFRDPSGTLAPKDEHMDYWTYVNGLEEPELVRAPAGPPRQFCPDADVPKSMQASGGWTGGDHRSAQVFASNEGQPFTASDTFVSVRVPVWGLRMRLRDDTACCHTDCTRVCERLGLPSRIPVQVRQEMYHCAACTLANRVFCSGRHGCTYAPLRGLDDAQAAWLRANGVPFDSPMSYDTLARAVHLLARHFLAGDQGFDGSFRVTPEAAPYYLSVNVDSFAYFDSSKARDYIRSVTDGVSQDLRECALRVEGDTSADYEKCSSDEYLRELRAFVDDTYRHDAFVRVPPGGTAAWVVDQEQLLAPSVFAYAAHERPLRDRFATWLLDIERHCESGSLYDSICFRESGTHFTLVNPWVGGDFNPVDFCDTPFDPEEEQRVIDVFCNKPTCPGYYQGRKELDRFYRAIPDACDRGRGGAPTRLLPRGSSAANLCSKAPVAQTICRHAQASLGGVLDPGGVAVDGESVADLYTEVEGAPTPGGLLWPPRNRLFEGTLKQGEGVQPVALHGGDIGGTHLHVVARADGSLRMRDVVLGHPLPVDADFLEASLTDREPDLSWLANFEGLVAVEHAAAERRTASAATTSDALSWDCPFLRLHYWSGTDATFSPPVPDARRAAVMFGGITDERLVHPLQTGGVGNVARLRTANGRCFCTNDGDCARDLSSTGECGLLQAIRSTYDEEWRQAQTAGGGVCYDQTDWPFAGGTLRDGTVLPEGRFQANCSVLERLPPFQYRLKNVPFRAASATPRTTSAPGGDCHGARGTQWVDTGGVRCRLEEKNDTHTVLRCADGTFPVLARERSRAPAEIVAAARAARRRCADASPPPEFVSGRGQPIFAASSFGLHARVAAERFIAADLHRLVCGAANCSAATWRRGTFLPTLMQDPAALFASPPTEEEAYAPHDRLLADDVPPDGVLWETPWVACTRDEKTHRITGCAGTISRSAWLDPTTRAGACTDAIREHADTRLALNVTLCDIDGRTDALCEVLANAESDVQEAHCHAAGACLSESFFYHPATFSRTNEQFIRETVEEFYLETDAGACPEAAAELAAQLRQARDNRDSCAAVWVEGVIVILEGLRVVLHSVVRLVYYTAMMFATLLRFLGIVNVQEVLQDLLRYFQQLLEEARDLIEAAFEVVWRGVLESPLGKQFLDLVQRICSFVVSVYNFVKDNVCVFLLAVFEAIHDIQDGLRSTFVTAWIVSDKDYNKVLEGIARFKTCLEDDLKCDLKKESPRENNPALPSPTRCWAQYVTSFGDPGSLSCTAADTCVRELGDTSAPGDENLICDACPAAPEGVNDFGCDPLRKVCACGVLQRERTPCLNHFQCRTQEDASCLFMDANVEASFGTIGCSQCSSRPLCIRTAGTEEGFCSCMLSPVGDEPCTTVGRNVIPGGQGLCLAATGVTAAALGASTAFVAEYPRLLSIPCATAAITETYCFEVQYSAFVTLKRVVALDILQTGVPAGPFRRLLGAPFFDAPWADATGVCAALAEADTLRPLERERFDACLRWRQTARDVIARHNLSHVDEHFLLSAQDFAAAVGDFHALAELVTHPAWVLDVALRSAMARPVLEGLRLLRRWALASDYTDSPWVPFARALFQRDPGFELAAPDPYENREHENRSTPRETFATFGLARRLLADGAVRAPPVNFTAGPARRLLEWRFNLSAAAEFSLQLSLSGDATQEIPPDLAAEWVTGPARWPPDYSYWENGTADCVAGRLTWDILRFAINYTVNAYAGTGPPAAVPTRSFRKSALVIPRLETLPARDERDPTRGDLAVDATYWALDRLADWGIDRASFAGLFSVIPETIDDFLTCDFEAVMFCTRYHRTLWNSFWWMVIYSSIALYFLQFTRFPYRGVILSAVFIPLVLFYSAGVALRCAPMLPPCVLDESIEITSALLPTRLHFPNALQAYPGCLGDRDQSMRPPEIPANATCIISCGAEPHGYTRWEAPVAWWLCDFDRTECLRLLHWLADRNVTFTETLRRFLAQKAQIAGAGDADLVTAQRLCAGVTSWLVVPWVLLLVVALYAATWGVLVLVVLGQGAVAVVVQAMLMTHVSGDARRPWRNIFVRRALRERRE